MNLFKRNSVVNCRYISNVARVLMAPLMAAAMYATPTKADLITQYEHDGTYTFYSYVSIGW